MYQKHQASTSFPQKCKPIKKKKIKHNQIMKHNCMFHQDENPKIIRSVQSVPSFPKIGLPYGKRLHNYGKSLFFIGKLGKVRISMAISNNTMLNCQRLDQPFVHWQRHPLGKYPSPPGCCRGIHPQAGEVGHGHGRIVELRRNSREDLMQRGAHGKSRIGGWYIFDVELGVSRF